VHLPRGVRPPHVGVIEQVGGVVGQQLLQDAQDADCLEKGVRAGTVDAGARAGGARQCPSTVHILHSPIMGFHGEIMGFATST
jgi:hypothetical protein